jgi:anthranilate synthase/aminodeoxychorismate synthase-like glutamine amidotransferase
MAAGHTSHGRRGPIQGPVIAGRARIWSLSRVILVVDNRDSFTWNLVQYLMELGQEVCVERAKGLSPDGVRELAPTHILIGPGPGGPGEATEALELVRVFAGEMPLLGVCLGLQVIALAHGSRVERAPEPVHGHAQPVHHDGRGVFRGLPDPLMVGRYHSLAVDEASLSNQLEVSARTEDGVVMGLRHTTLAVEAVQFHPESILSEAGHALLENFCAAQC